MMDVMVAASTSGERERREGGDAPAAVKGPTKDGRADPEALRDFRNTTRRTHNRENPCVSRRKALNDFLVVITVFALLTRLASSPLLVLLSSFDGVSFPELNLQVETQKLQYRPIQKRAQGAQYTKIKYPSLDHL